MELPKEARDSLKCCQCKKYLSIFPIYAGANENLFCGRCPQPSTDVKRQTVYEKLAKFLKFPCKNQHFGCRKSATPEKIEIHENECRYRKWDCFEKCGWNGRSMELSDHYSGLHSHLMIKPEENFKISFAREVEDFRVVLASHNSVFLVKLTKLQADLFASVFYLHPDDSGFGYKCEITFQTSEKVIITKMLDVPIKSIASVLNSDETSVFKIKASDVVSFNVKIVNAKSNLCKTNDSIVEQFLCPRHKQYIVPPIFNCQCPNGKIICPESPCNKCKDCKGILTPNPGLERVARSIHYPCLNKECDAILKHNELEEHRIRCNHTIQQCGFDGCTFRAKFDQVYAHLKSNHPNAITLRYETKSDILFYEDEFFDIHTDDSIFKVSYCFEKKMLRFRVTCGYSRNTNLITYKNWSNKFQFELIIRNGSNESMYFKTNSTYVYIPSKVFKTSGKDETSDWSYVLRIIEEIN